MDAQNVLSAKNRSEFRSWLAGNSQIASECWVTVKRGKPTDETEFWYIDAEEEALCFGWIDSNHKLINGVRMQRFTPQKEKQSVDRAEQSLCGRSVNECSDFRRTHPSL